MLVLLSTTLNHKDITYRRQTPSSNSGNTCNILFNTGNFFWDKQQNPLKGALSLISHSRPWTHTTCQKLSDQLGCMHMHSELHVKNISMFFWFSSTSSQDDAWLVWMISLGAGIICLGCFVYFLSESQKEKKKDFSRVYLLRAGAMRKTAHLELCSWREGKRVSNGRKAWEQQE